MVFERACAARAQKFGHALAWKQYSAWRELDSMGQNDTADVTGRTLTLPWDTLLICMAPIGPPTKKAAQPPYAIEGTRSELHQQANILTSILNITVPCDESGDEVELSPLIFVIDMAALSTRYQLLVVSVL